MGTSQSKPEIYLLLNLGMSPTDISNMGIVGKTSAYKYNQRFQLARARLVKLLSNGYHIDKKGNPSKAVK